MGKTLAIKIKCALDRITTNQLITDGLHLLAVYSPNVAIARRIQYDKYDPLLAPNATTFFKYLPNIKTQQWTPEEWANYKRDLKNDMRSTPKSMALMRELAEKYADSEMEHVTIMCYCKDENRCHRSIVRDMILEIAKEIATASSSSPKSTNDTTTTTTTTTVCY